MGSWTSERQRIHYTSWGLRSTPLTSWLKHMEESSIISAMNSMGSTWCISSKLTWSPTASERVNKDVRRNRHPRNKCVRRIKSGRPKSKRSLQERWTISARECGEWKDGQKGKYWTPSVCIRLSCCILFTDVMIRGSVIRREHIYHCVRTRTTITYALSTYMVHHIHGCTMYNPLYYIIYIYMSILDIHIISYNF